MVLDLLIHKLWGVLKSSISPPESSQNNIAQKQDNSNVPVSFPQGAQFLDYRQNKNMRGLPYLSMSERDNFDKASYVNEINNQKKKLHQSANETMAKNLELAEGFVTRGVLDGDYEYYKRESDKMRDRQISEQIMFKCLTGKDTCLSESNVFQAKHISYNQYTQPGGSKLQPWELQNMSVKTSPDILCDMDLLNQHDRDTLKQAV